MSSIGENRIKEMHPPTTSHQALAFHDYPTLFSLSPILSSVKKLIFSGLKIGHVKILTAHFVRFPLFHLENVWDRRSSKGR